MKIDDLKNAKLSATTQGYLAIYLQLGEMCGTISDVTSIEYRAREVDAVNRECYDAISNAQDQVMKLVNKSIIENISVLGNSTEI